MSYAAQSPSTQHKQAASDHEIAALQHRTAAEFHDKQMLYAARLSSEDAMACCIKAHRQSMLACERSAWKAPAGTA
jgi:predicted DNA binding CopG/RHH family protein